MFIQKNKNSSLIFFKVALFKLHLATGLPLGNKTKTKTKAFRQEKHICKLSACLQIIKYVNYKELGWCKTCYFSMTVYTHITINFTA